ncbi:hypothetical protein PHMEG_00023869 [Phytophthora megakarya]|uniref:Reverse transcriptase domain-containing protein n=1 Tax=Phytophthora megakarya TaxID=4795 RepID=A0A225VGK5_9STRA|nr:hypothetical protein PHMEG_00023869 [Phytophthora megakarya]
MSTSIRVAAKITLGWNTVYEYDFWVMEHSAGSEVVLGTDFMIPAGIRLDWFHATAKLPDKVMIPLVKAQNFDDDIPEGMHVPGGPNDNLQIAAGEWADFRLQRNKPSLGTHDGWVRRTPALIPTITKFRKGQPTFVRLTNILSVVMWVPREYLPKMAGYVQVGVPKYEEWQVIAYTGARDETGCVDQWSIDGGSPELARATSAQDDLPDAESSSDRAVIEAIDDDTDVCPRSLPVDDVNSGLTDWGDAANAQETPGSTQYRSEKTSEEALVDLERTFVCVMHVLFTEGRNKPSDDDYDEHEANYISLEDYAPELAFLPDLTEPSVTALDYEGSNVKNLTDEQQQRLVEMLKSHESIMISSGNALPPPSYGVVCDIDVNNPDPIKQRARRIPLRYLQKLYELLKGLLKAGLIAFSDSPWASPIVIVLKKNGEDIRLCIDYKMVNTVTAILEYAMPLVDDLLTELESYLWFCSLDAASGFWAILMTMRARMVSTFVCALGHFE